MTSETRHSSLDELTATIVTAYVERALVPPGDLPALITSVKAALLGGLASAEQPPRRPAVPIEESIAPDYLISLEDGRRYKSLKPHLRALGMTADDYRAKWRLPPTYPMVSASYAQKRSELARKFGLGKKRLPVVTGPKPSPAPLARNSLASSLSQPNGCDGVQQREDELSHH